MKAKLPRIIKPTVNLLLVLSLGIAQQTSACGGFFCDVVPIDQAGEQIVFRQEGDQTTAMIKIDYVGNAKDFGWVLPVPNVPELSLGSDQTFTDLESSTRPQFLLERKGQGCFNDFAANSGSSSSSSSSGGTSSSGSASGGVIIEKVVSVGPFDAQIISSDEPKALADWLVINNLDLTSKGSELLKPYIDAKSKFVVLKLKNNANAGNIQPIILKYKSSAPVIPMTLTAVAAQENMGVLVWLLGDNRGVPKNFKHVTPNYSRLNWFRGTRTAYASYQTLITQAMDEAGGQGFATDFAGYLPNLAEGFSNAQNWETRLASQANSSDPMFISTLWNTTGNTILRSIIREGLPTSDTFVYSRPLIMQELFTVEQLKQTREAVATAVEEQLIKPINNAIDILDDDLYLTRLYTTLSAEEMSINPEFTFNPSMGTQSLSRSATLTSACIEGQNHWTLKLGKGTGRDGELIAEAWGFTPPFRPVITNTEQEAVWQVAKTSATSDPVVVAQSKFEPLVLGNQASSSSSTSSSSTSSSSTSSSSNSSSGNPNNTSSSSSGGTGKTGGSMDLLTLSLFSFLLALSGTTKTVRRRLVK